LAPMHGVSMAAGCDTLWITSTPKAPTCAFTFANTFDPDVVFVSGVRAVVYAPDGADPSGNLLPTADLTLSGGATCNVTVTLCTVPPGGRISGSFEYHKVTRDQAASTSEMSVDIHADWGDLCTSGSD